MELKNIFKMTKTDRYTQDGRDELAKLQETEDVTYKTGDISQKTGLQKQPDGSWAPPKNGAKAGKQSKPAAKPTTEELSTFKDIVREFKKNPNKQTEQIMNEAKSHLMKNRGMTPEQLGKIGREVMAESKPAEKHPPMVMPKGMHPAEFMKAWEDDAKKNGYEKGQGNEWREHLRKEESKPAGSTETRQEYKGPTNPDHDEILQKMKSAEGYGHVKNIGDYEVYRVTSGPEKGKYKVSLKGSNEEMTMSENQAAKYLLNQKRLNERSSQTEAKPTDKYKDLPGAQKKDALFASTFEGISIGQTQNQMERHGWELISTGEETGENVNVYGKPDGSKVTMKHDGQKITSSEYEAPGSKPETQKAISSDDVVTSLDEMEKTKAKTTKNIGGVKVQFDPQTGYKITHKAPTGKEITTGYNNLEEAHQAVMFRLNRIKNGEIPAISEDAAPKIRQLTGDTKIRIRK